MMIDVYDLLKLAEEVGYDCNIYILPGIESGVIEIRIDAVISNIDYHIQGRFFDREYQDEEHLKEHLIYFSELAKEYFEGFDR